MVWALILIWAFCNIHSDFHMEKTESNTYRKDLNWLLYVDEPRVLERQQVKDQHFNISIFVVYLTIPSSS